MRVSLEEEMQVFWQNAKAIRERFRNGTLTEDDEDLDQICVTHAYTEYDHVRELCEELLAEVSPR